MKNWNPLRASFYLLATIIGVEVGLVIITYSICVWWDITHPETPKHCEGVKQPLMEVLQSAIATVMAFSAGRLSGDNKDDESKPD